MTDLPPGWEWATLGELADPEPRSITDGPFGSNLTSAHYTNSGARVIRLQNIGDGEFRDERAYISLEHFETLRNHEVSHGDLVVASLGDSPPRVCLLPQLDAPAVVKADCIRVRLDSRVEPRWVLYALQTPETKQFCAGLIRGVGRPRLGLSRIREIHIPVAPLAEQRRIVADLESHLSKLEVGEKSLADVEHKTSVLRRAVVSEAVADLVDSETTLGEVLVEPLVNGRSVPTLAGGFGVLRLTALRNGRIDVKERKDGAWSADDAAPFLIRQDDFLVSRGNGSLELVGRGGLVAPNPPPVAFPDTLIRVRVDQNLIDKDYLRILWDSKFVRAQIEAGARTTAGIYKINQTLLRGVRLPVPSLPRQRNVVDRVEGVALTAGICGEIMRTAQLRSAQLRRSLLADAFAGRLVQQDPEDEPAWVLLDRIRAERDNTEPTSRRRRATALSGSRSDQGGAGGH